MQKIPPRRPRRDSTAANAERSVAEAQAKGLVPPVVFADDDTFADALESGRERDYRAGVAKGANRSTGASPFKVAK
jgi:hypothetical protein